MSLTIFYAWQSDRPPKVNRNFIESALTSATKKINQALSLEPAPRPAEFSVDRDTKSVPGTPPIADTIFQKIEGCAVFVADVTFIGESDRERLVCNPNVLIEYGYARAHSLGTSCLVPVMNTAFGGPGKDKEKLPFDMRHLRAPICYELHENADTEERARVKRELTKELKNAILEIIESGLIDEMLPKPEPFPEVSRQQWRSSYYTLGESLVRYHDEWEGRDRSLTVPAGPKLYLRVIPHELDEELDSVDALDLIQKAQLLPMRSKHVTGGVSWHRNKYGAVAYSSDDRRITSLSQLHKNKEIWGIDTILGRFNRIVHHGFEEVFTSMLPHYLSFADTGLELSFPVTIEAGITKIEGFQIEAPPGLEIGHSRYGGRFVEAEVYKRFTAESSEVVPEELLLPFFEHVLK
jgi:hypothetical protein